MQRFLAIVIGALALVVLGVLLLSVYGQYLLIADPTIPQSQRFALLPAIAVSAGVLVAILTFLRERQKTGIERERHVSEVALTRATQGFGTVIDLLSNRNNSRVVWIRAARALLQATRLGSQISSEEYRIAYQLEEERARNELYTILSLPDEKTNGRKPLPPQFFYGIDDWANCQTLDDAAVRASQHPVAYSVTIDSVPPQSSSPRLSVRSVIAIFSFLEYPTDYDDPLDDVTEWDDNWDSLVGVDQGARRYVAHRKQKVAFAGKLHEQSSGEAPNGPSLQPTSGAGVSS